MFSHLTKAKIMCSSICKCIGCKNFEESPERKTLMHLADAAEVRVQQQTAAKTKLSSQISDLLTRTTPVITSGAGRYKNTFLHTSGKIKLELTVSVSFQVTIYVCHKGGAGSDMRVSTGTGQKGRTDSSAISRGRALDPGRVWTLPHEYHQFCRESQSRLLPLIARLSTGSPSIAFFPSCGGQESWVTLQCVTDPRISCPEGRWVISHQMA